MACTHKRIRCTNCKFFCLDCGAEIEAPAKAEEPKPAKKRGKGQAKK